MPIAFAEIPRISPDEVSRRRDNGDPMLIVDVRPTEAFERGHIAAARSAPLNVILRGESDLPMGQDVFLYCSCIDEVEAAWAGAALRNQGYERVFVIRNGLMGWMDRGYPISPGWGAGQEVNAGNPRRS